jgi:hypothetical protein
MAPNATIVYSQYIAGLDFQWREDVSFYVYKKKDGSQFRTCATFFIPSLWSIVSILWEILPL